MEEALRLTIRPSNEFDEDENRQIEAVDRLAFAGSEDDLDWASGEWLAVGKLAGQIVCITGILKRRIQVGEMALDVGGISGVATHPDHQRHGFGSLLLQRAAEFMGADLHVDFGFLVCGKQTIPFYSKLGWEVVEAEMVFDFRGAKRLFQGTIMVLPLGEKCWPAGRIDLCGAPW
jgi:GNAT superfamily N-acetyltransferase